MTELEILDSTLKKMDALGLSLDSISKEELSVRFSALRSSLVELQVLLMQRMVTANSEILFKG